MTDFFVLFDQPRQPWLDSDVLKEKYHQLTRLAHPDVHGREARLKFEEVNEAYRVLSDPRLRIQHLLNLEGHSPTASANRALPEDLQQLFLQIGTLTQKMQHVLSRIGDGSGALTLSLAKSELLQIRSQAARLLEQLSNSWDTCLTELRELNHAWDKSRSRANLQLQTLHDRMAYLSRWMAQLREMEFQLSLRD